MKSSSFFDLQSMLLLEDNHTGASTSTHADNKLLYTEEDRTRGRGGRDGSARNGGGRQEQNQRHNRHADSSSGPSGSKGSLVGAENRQGKPATDCWYYSRKGHKERECWKKKADSD